ncbi:MAG: MFS transporter [Bacteroidota bacterium]
MYLNRRAQQDSLISWIISITAAGFFFFDFVQIGMMNVLGKDIGTALGLSRAYAVYYVNIPFALGNWIWIFPAAMLIDRFSIRKVMMSMLALSVIGAFGTAWSKVPLFTALFRFASGTAHSFCFLCCTTLVRRWFSSSQRATVMSIAVAIGVSGLLAAQLPLYLLNSWLGWRAALSVNASLGIILWLLSFCFVSDYPVGQNPTLSSRSKNPLQGFLTAISHGQIWLYSLYTACLNAPIPAIVFAFLNDFLIHIHQVKNAQFASAMASVLFLGHIMGISFAGFISDQWKSRKKPMLLGSLCAFTLLSIFFFYTPLPSAVIVILLFVLGALLGAQVISYPAISEISDPAVAATSMSIASFVIMGSFPILEAVTPLMLSYVRGNTTLYTKSIYLWGFSPVLIAVGASFLIASVVKETYLFPRQDFGNKQNK